MLQGRLSRSTSIPLGSCPPDCAEGSSRYVAASLFGLMKGASNSGRQRRSLTSDGIKEVTIDNTPSPGTLTVPVGTMSQDQSG